MNTVFVHNMQLTFCAYDSTLCERINVRLNHALYHYYLVILLTLHYYDRPMYS